MLEKRVLRLEILNSLLSLEKVLMCDGIVPAMLFCRNKVLLH